MKIAFRALAAISVGLLVFWGISTIAHARYVYPTPETQSDFLKTYSPIDMVNLFKEKYSSHASTSGESIAGYRFVTHRADRQEYFVVKTEAKPALVSAIQDDISTQLLKVGARITAQTQTASGIEIRYEVGNTRGLVSITAPEGVDPRTVAGPLGICADEAAIKLRVRIAETWSKARPGSRTDWPTLNRL